MSRQHAGYSGPQGGWCVPNLMHSVYSRLQPASQMHQTTNSYTQRSFPHHHPYSKHRQMSGPGRHHQTAGGGPYKHATAGQHQRNFTAAAVVQPQQQDQASPSTSNSVFTRLYQPRPAPAAPLFQQTPSWTSGDGGQSASSQQDELANRLGIVLPDMVGCPSRASHSDPMIPTTVNEMEKISSSQQQRGGAGGGYRGSADTRGSVESTGKLSLGKPAAGTVTSSQSSSMADGMDLVCLLGDEDETGTVSAGTAGGNGNNCAGMSTDLYEGEDRDAMGVPGHENNSAEMMSERALLPSTSSAGTDVECNQVEEIGGTDKPSVAATMEEAGCPGAFVAPIAYAGTAVTPSFGLVNYQETTSVRIWQNFIENRQNDAVYIRKVHLRNALHMVMSCIFENAGLFIVGSSMNGFGSDKSDMDLCLTITARELHQKKEALVVLSQLVQPLRKCSFIRSLQLIRAKVPILKFRDTLAEVDCDLNINNVIGIYNTHLLSVYARVDWRVRPLGMFVKFWAQCLDIHDASRGRLSTYSIILMVIQFLQAGCSPPVLPSLQARFPKQFSYERPVKEIDMRLQLPWSELRSINPASLAELFTGFIEFYAEQFDFTQYAVSVRHGSPLPIHMVIQQMPPHEQLAANSFKLFVEEPFSQTNTARALFDDSVFARIERAFRTTLRALRLQKPLDIILNNPV